jgi:hypothetical protein
MKTLTLLFVLLLTACGGGDPDIDQDHDPQAAGVRVVRAAFFGESTQLGANTNGVSAVSVAERRLNNSGVAVELLQHGVGKSSAYELLTGTDGVHHVPFGQTLAAMNVQIVAFRFGIPDRLQYDDVMFYAYMEALVSQAEAEGKVVILQTSSPVDLPSAERKVERNARAIRRLAEAHPLAVLCDHMRVGMAQGYENSDGIHPTARDYRLRQGPTLSRCIREAIDRLR